MKSTARSKFFGEELAICDFFLSAAFLFVDWIDSSSNGNFCNIWNTKWLLQTCSARNVKDNEGIEHLFYLSPSICKELIELMVERWCKWNHIFVDHTGCYAYRPANSNCLLCPKIWYDWKFQNFTMFSNIILTS